MLEFLNAALPWLMIGFIVIICIAAPGKKK